MFDMSSKPPNLRTIRVTAPHFVAGLVVSESGVIVSAAPIIGYAHGKVFDEIRSYFARRNWHVEEL